VSGKDIHNKKDKKTLTWALLVSEEQRTGPQVCWGRSGCSTRWTRHSKELQVASGLGLRWSPKSQDRLQLRSRNRYSL